MPSGKARYQGSKVRSVDNQVAAFSVLERELRRIMEEHADAAKRKKRRRKLPYHDPVDGFVHEILQAADWGFDALQDCRSSLLKQDLQAECVDLLETITGAEVKLRHLSSEVDRLLGPAACPLTCADALRALIPSIEAAQEKIASLPHKPKPLDAEAEVVAELAIRVLKIAHSHGIEISAYASSDHGSMSRAVALLQVVSGAIDLHREPSTWKGLIVELKAEKRLNLGRRYARPSGCMRDL